MEGRVMKKTINVITIRGGKARHETIKNDLQTMQKIVGGHIEAVTVKDGLVVICDEEGRLKGKPETMVFEGQIFVGDLVICGADGEEFADVPRCTRIIKTEVENDAVAEGNDQNYWPDREAGRKKKRGWRLTSVCVV
jgi:hypothetical protein